MGTLGGGAVAATMVVGGILSAGVSAVLHDGLCWPNFQCETDPCMYPYLIVFNRVCVAHFNCPFFVSIFVCLYLSVIYLSVLCYYLWDIHGFLIPGSSSLFRSPVFYQYSL